MKILFVGSGTDGAAIVKAQGESLRRSGHRVEYLLLKEGGFKGYSQAYFRLRTVLKEQHHDIIHSHYLLSSIIASFASGRKPVVSLMGSDVFDSSLFRSIIRILSRYRWSQTIVKSVEMKERLGLENIHVIPNGVDLEQFYPMDKAEARRELGWDNRLYILFGSNPERKEKNYKLAEEACSEIKDQGVVLVPLMNIPHNRINTYLNACDLMLLTSFYEGSPNIIKEAMACNCPFVSTDVGDVRWIMGDTDGCYIAEFEARDVAMKILRAARFREQERFTRGRDFLVSNKLDSKSVADRLTDIYQSVQKADGSK